jgi:hypothetical protein
LEPTDAKVDHDEIFSADAGRRIPFKIDGRESDVSQAVSFTEFGIPGRIVKAGVSLMIFSGSGTYQRGSMCDQSKSWEQYSSFNNPQILT